MQRFSAPPPARLGARASGRDPYADLLHDTRNLRAEDRQARETFLRRLGAERSDALFELEILLKGVVCFGNPRNHTGPRPGAGSAGGEFRAQLAVLSDGLKRVQLLAHRCLGRYDRPSGLQRDLVFVSPDEAQPASPESELLQLRRSLSGLADLAAGLLQLEHVPFRLFFAMAGAVQREVARNSFFNPLSALEFRPEFDRIASPELMDLMRRAPGESAQRLAALTLLSLFRMVRYLKMIEEAGADDPPDGRVFLLFAVFRADARALSLHLRRRGGELLAEAFERDVLGTPAHELELRREALHVSARRFVDLRSAFESIVANLRLELRRVFERQLPAPSSAPDQRAHIEARRGVEPLREALYADLLLLGRALGRNLDEQTLFEQQPDKRQRWLRTRQNVWMFDQIVRAFAVKARHAQGDEARWSTSPGLEFAREFLTYFHAIGYGLLRCADYGRLVVFVDAIAPLRDPDTLDGAKVARAIAECDAVHEFLTKMLEQAAARPELAGVPFDKRAAAEALRKYLGD